MHEAKQFDWVSNVLQDVITFLTENNLEDSAQVLADALAFIELDLQKLAPPTSPLS
jgi:hypothetical protein